MMWRRFVKGAAALAPLLLLGAVAPSAPPAPHYGQVVVHEQIYIRVTGQGANVPRQIRWKEGKGPKCVPARLVAGYAIVAPASVDFFLRDNRRIRAHLESSCPALDYYRGFYVTPNPDGMICADRDVIRSRMGGECGIDKFRTLKAKRGR
jgi:hypothetical protein